MPACAAPLPLPALLALLLLLRRRLLLPPPKPPPRLRGARFAEAFCFRSETVGAAAPVADGDEAEYSSRPSGALTAAGRAAPPRLGQRKGAAEALQRPVGAAVIEQPVIEETSVQEGSEGSLLSQPPPMSEPHVEEPTGLLAGAAGAARPPRLKPRRGQLNESLTPS